MFDALQDPKAWRSSPWRFAMWMGAALPLLLPLVAMQFTSEVNWTAEDFIFAGVVVALTAIPLDLVMCRIPGAAYRSGVALALAGLFLLTWLSASVGIIGYDGDPANLMYLAVIVTGASGAIVARLHPAGMARTLIAMAVVQAVIATIAIAFGLGRPWSGVLELAGLNGFFIVLFLACAALFYRAAREASAAKGVAP